MKRSLLLSLTIMTALLLAVGCASLKKQRTKLALADCRIELKEVTPDLRDAEILVHVPLDHGGKRTHNLRKPSLGLLVDLPLMQEGLAEWEVNRLGLHLGLVVSNRSGKNLHLDSLTIDLTFGECTLPVRVADPLSIPGDTTVLRKPFVRVSLNEKIIRCAQTAEQLKIALRTVVGWKLDDPDPVVIEWGETRPFPKEELNGWITQAQEEFLGGILGF